MDLVSAQIRLARLEVSADLSQGAKRAARAALFLPPLIGGYAFAMSALAAWLETYWSRPIALAAVAGLQLVVAGLGIPWSLSALRKVRLMERAVGEVTDGARRTLAVVSAGTKRSDV